MLDASAGATEHRDVADCFCRRSVNVRSLESEGTAREKDVENLAVTIRQDSRNPHGSFDDLVAVGRRFTLGINRVATGELYHGAAQSGYLARALLKKSTALIASGWIFELSRRRCRQTMYLIRRRSDLQHGGSLN